MPSRGRRSQELSQRTKSVVDAPEGSETQYCGAMIRESKTGPRRELTLRIETWPKGKPTFGGGDLVTLRFGAIFNHDEVQRFFTKVRYDGLHYLRELSESTPRWHVVELEFDRTGDRIRIIAGKVSKLVCE